MRCCQHFNFPRQKQGLNRRMERDLADWKKNEEKAGKKERRKAT